MLCLQRNLSSVSLYVFPSSSAIVLKHHSTLQLSLLLNMCSRGTLLDSLNSSKKIPILFYRVPPIFLELGRICFGTPRLLNPTIVDDGKYVLINNLHAMGGICKEGCIWGFLIKFSFGLLQNLTSGTFGWMLEHSLYCAIIISDDENNDKEAIIECILYHLQNCIILHNI